MKSESSNEMLKHALAYHALGWNIIPVIGSAKTPPEGCKWKQFHETRMTTTEVQQLRTSFPDTGIAAVSGKISGFVVLDIDLKHGRTPKEFRIPPTVTSRTQSGGWHFYFKHPGYFVKGSKGVLFGPGVDIQGDKNIVILPPTEGLSGSYQWEIEPSNNEDLADMPDWLVEAIQKGASVTSFAPLNGILGGVHEGQRNDAACINIGTLLARSEPNTWEEAWFLLKEWNKNYCKPPEEERVLRGKFESLAMKELAKRQGGVATGIVTGSYSSPQPVSVLTPPISMKELSEKDLPPTDWDVEQLIDHGTPNMLSAPHQSYKSWILVHMALCIATGKPLFGKFATKKQPVLIVNQEDTERILKDRANMMLNGESNDLAIHWHIGKAIRLTDEYIELLIQDAYRLGATVMMFDSLITLHGADENSSTEMQLVMNQLKKINAAGITVIFTHHHRKKVRGPGGKQEDNGEESRGSSSINAAIHGHLSSEPKTIEGEKKLVISQHKLKCAAKIEPFVVSINQGMDSMKFEYEGEYDAGETMREQVINSIVELLKSNKEWLSRKDFEDRLHASESTVRKALKVLELGGKVVGEKRSVLLTRGESLSYDNGSHQEKFYQLNNPTQDDDSKVSQQTLDDF